MTRVRCYISEITLSGLLFTNVFVGVAEARTALQSLTDFVQIIVKGGGLKPR